MFNDIRLKNLKNFPFSTLKSKPPQQTLKSNHLWEGEKEGGKALSTNVTMASWFQNQTGKYCFKATTNLHRHKVRSRHELRIEPWN